MNGAYIAKKDERKKKTGSIGVKAIVVREMTANDLPEVLAIERVSFPTPWSEVIFREELLSPFCHSFVATVDRYVVGYIDFAIIIDEAHVRNISVHRDFRRTGIGSLLLAQMIDSSVRRGVEWCTLEVRKSNTDAIKLYEKFGFVIRGIRPMYYRDTREDALVMWASIQDMYKSVDPEYRKT